MKEANSQHLINHKKTQPQSQGLLLFQITVFKEQNLVQSLKMGFIRLRRLQVTKVSENANGKGFSLLPGWNKGYILLRPSP